LCGGTRHPFPRSSAMRETRSLIHTTLAAGSHTPPTPKMAYRKKTDSDAVLGDRNDRFSSTKTHEKPSKRHRQKPLQIKHFRRPAAAASPPPRERGPGGGFANLHGGRRHAPQRPPRSRKRHFPSPRILSVVSVVSVISVVKCLFEGLRGDRLLHFTRDAPRRVWSRPPRTLLHDAPGLVMHSPRHLLSQSFTEI
jgi:hypothetical protein